MKKIILLFVASFAFSKIANAAQQFPNVSGNILMQLEVDRILSSNKQGVEQNNAYIYSEPKLSLNFNHNWSVKTEWRLQQNNTLTTRDKDNPERYRTFMNNDRNFGFSEAGILIEQLKVHFQNEDMEFSAGKFDPTFGTAHNKAKRIGVFTSQFTEDYNLREKIGANLTALLENSKITISSFFNDTTDLSKSSFNDRGRAQRSDNIAGNTGTLSSYAISMEGHNPFGIKNWNYNFGYRNLSVDNAVDRDSEKGYVVGSEYLYKASNDTYLIPFIEIVKINNFTGESGKDALYTTIAGILRYSSWTASISSLKRDINSTNNKSSSNGRQIQVSAGYKFTNNFTVDVSRSNIREDGSKGALFGVVFSYFYKF